MSKKAASNRSREGSLESKSPHPYVAPESEIRDYVNSVGIHELRTVGALFQVVADLTSTAFEEGKDQLKPSDLALIKRLADEDDSEPYRKIMRAIIAGIGQGRHGINAAHLTATVAVGMTFRWSPEYRSALEDYRNEMRGQMRRKLGRSSSRVSKRSASLLANDR